MKLRSVFRTLIVTVLITSIIFIARWKVRDLFKLASSSVHQLGQISTNDKRPSVDPASSPSNIQIVGLKVSNALQQGNKLIKNAKAASQIFPVNQNNLTTPNQLNNQPNPTPFKDSSPKPKTVNPPWSILNKYEENVDVVADKIMEINQHGEDGILPKIYISKETKSGRKLELKYGNFSLRCKNMSYPFQDLFCLNKLPYLEDVKNPCWYEGISVKTLKLRCLPYFVILGCAKCATTDLYSRLVKHQHILQNDAFGKKEALYWSWKRYGITNFKHYPAVSFEEFTSYFNPLSDLLSKLNHQKSNLVHQLIIGDASPPDFWDFRAWPLLPQNEGLSEPEVFTPQLMQYIYRNPKFILLFRNPTDRLYSDYFFLKQGNTAESFHEAVVISISAVHECLSSHTERYCFFSSKLFAKLKCRIHYGCYSVFLKEWFSVFERKQFYIARTKDYSDDIETHIKQIYEFLRVEPVSQSKMDKIESQKRSNVSKLKKKSSTMLLKTRKILDKFYAKYNKQLAKLLQNKKYEWSEANVFNQKRMKWEKT